MTWFGARTMFRYSLEGALRQETLVEHRVVLFDADDADGAMRMAEEEASRYAEDLAWVNQEGARVVGVYLGACDVFEITQDLSSGAEVYSSISLHRAPDSDRQLVEQHFGPERDAAVDEVMSLFEPDFERGASDDS